MTEVKRILVRGTNWVGDAVMQIPALRRLRRVFPAAAIVLLTRSWAKGIYQDTDLINDIIAFEKGASKFRDVFEQAKILRKGNFDLCVLFTNSFESAVVVKLAGIPRRFGYAKEGRSFLLTDAVKIPEWKNRRHEAFYYLNLVTEIEREFRETAAGLDDELEIDLTISDERKTVARKFLAASGVDLSGKIVALGVGSTNSRAKRWHAESFAELNDRLQNELGASVVLVGAKDELAISEQVFAAAKRKPTILTGKTDLAEAAALLSVVDLLVSNDMGLAHVAPAAGTPTLVIFGPTDERTTQPIGSQIVRRTVECAPCMLRDCPIDHRCMTGISAGEVFEKSKLILAGK
jgi:heptosyltransferase-2